MKNLLSWVLVPMKVFFCLGMSFLLLSELMNIGVVACFQVEKGLIRMF